MQQGWATTLSDHQRACADLFGDHLAGLTSDRFAHSITVGAALMDVAHTVPGRYRADLITAGVLHDVGYRSDLATTGFHPVDGAAYLATEGFSAIVCDLVATHTLATREAAERRLPAGVFAPFILVGNPEVEQLRQVITWADLTTGPTGERVTARERVAEILHRYPAEHVVHRYVRRHQALLERLGADPPDPESAVEPLVVQPGFEA